MKCLSELTVSEFVGWLETRHGEIEDQIDDFISGQDLTEAEMFENQDLQAMEEELESLESMTTYVQEAVMFYESSEPQERK